MLVTSLSRPQVSSSRSFLPVTALLNPQPWSRTARPAVHAASALMKWLHRKTVKRQLLSSTVSRSAAVRSRSMRQSLVRTAAVAAVAAAATTAAVGGVTAAAEDMAAAETTTADRRIVGSSALIT